MADVDVRRCRVQPKFDAQGLTGGFRSSELSNPFILGDQLLATAQGHRQGFPHLISDRVRGRGSLRMRDKDLIHKDFFGLADVDRPVIIGTLPRFYVARPALLAESKGCGCLIALRGCTRASRAPDQAPSLEFCLDKSLSQMIEQVCHTSSRWAQQLKTLHQRYPRRIAAAVAAALLIGAGGSYAVATLGPDASDLPVRQIVQTVQPLALPSLEDTQSNSLTSQPPLRLYRSDLTRSSDSADTLLNRLGLSDPAAVAFVRGNTLARKALLGRAGRLVTAEADDLHRLQRLTVRWISRDDTPEFERLVITRGDSGFAAQQETGRLEATTRMSGGTIQSSLFAATDEARIPDNVATQLADIFAGDIDFHRALRRGDRFSVVYESLEADGEPLRAGRVLSAEFVNNGKTFQAVWFQEPGTARGDYYSMNGQNLRRAYLASPLAFSRVTSGFKMRFHPILQTWRAHLGVDYGAPTGTPVRAVGDGVVETAGWQNGFGNLVAIKHRNGHSTVYAHLSRIDVKRGQTVSQGQHLGAVGATGWATGPHLHFEFRVNGQQKDPMLMARQSESIPVSEQARAQFLRQAAVARQDLTAAATLQVASIQ